MVVVMKAPKIEANMVEFDGTSHSCWISQVRKKNHFFFSHQHFDADWTWRRGRGGTSESFGAGVCNGQEQETLLRRKFLVFLLTINWHVYDLSQLNNMEPFANVVQCN